MAVRIIQVLMKVGESQEWIEEPIYTVNGERRVKRYGKVKLVGEGSYSKCWLVRTQNSDSSYVAKIIPKKKLQLLVKEKLVYQIRIHQQLSHPYVVHLDHWFQDECYQYILMEYCSEGNLEREVQKTHNMPEKDIRRYLRQVVEAISYIHSKNILHRDLKLCNFYLDSQLNVKLGDFGFACQLSHQGELKRETCGTPNYIAPEAVSGFGYSFSSDVWAIGVILFRLKFKLCPFEAKTVKQTLQKVKTCQYSFPKGEKISSELKDLIQKIFVINYDERLTLDQILAHPFFQKDSSRLNRFKSESKGSFAILRNMFSRERAPKEKQTRQSRLSGKDNDKNTDVAKRSNSCETFKEIKEIFKSKSKPTLITSQNAEQRTEQNMTMAFAQGGTGRERSSFLGGSTMRSIADTSFGMSAINRRLESSTRMNHFIGNVKEKMHTKLQAQQKQAPTGSQQLSVLSKRSYLPSEVHFEKDVVIISYRDSIKQLIYRGVGYILHRSKAGLFDMRGQHFTNPAKLLKYIIDNRIEIAEGEADEQEFGENTIEKIILSAAQKWVVLKDGVILFFGNAGLFVAKMANQQLFYLGSTSKESEQLREDGQVSLMYARQGRGYKCAEGVVLSRIYQGWVGSALKQAGRKEE